MNDYQSIISEIKDKKPKPVYVLMGEEGYYIDVISNAISKYVLTPEEKEFNYTIMYGRDVQVDDLINTAKRFPMLASYQVIIVKEAQSVAKLDRLEYYFQEPMLSTILVLEYRNGKIDARKKFYKLAQNIGIIYLSSRIYENKIPDWIVNYLRFQQINIVPIGAQLLCEYLGNDLSKIVNELDKLIVSLPDNKREITSELIEEKIGISKDFNNFELIRSLSQKDIYRSNQIINYFTHNSKNNPIIATLSTLFNFFSNLMLYYYLPDKSDKTKVAQILKIHPFLVNEYALASQKYTAVKVLYIISQIREYDARSKGIGNTSTSLGDLLKELVYCILH